MSSSRSGSERVGGPCQTRLRVEEASQTGEARRLAVALAQDLGFDETRAGEVAIVVTEAATNLVKHARQGELLFRPLADGPRRGLEVVALDRGPGLADVERAAGDGYSTAGSPGTGLGAMRRLASRLDLHSLPGAGTTAVAVLWADDPAARVGGRSAAGAAPRAEQPAMDVGAVSLPHPSERVCGDAWALRWTADGAVLLLADGLGHGPAAEEAAAAVVASFAEDPGRAPGDIVQAAHEAARSTRGAAVAVAQVDARGGRVRYAGVGNISGVLLGGARQQHMVSHSGTVGHQLRRVQEFTYEWGPDAVLVMHSDGLTTSWRLDRYPGLLRRHPALVAATLYRDASRGRDDATVVVLRERPEAP